MTDPATTALLAMDLQTGLLPRVADGPALLDRVATAVAAVRRRGGHVGWVRVGFTDADFDAIPATSVMSRFTDPALRDNVRATAPAAQLHERLDVRPHDVVVRKTRIGAFSTTDLDRQLRARGVTTLLLAGISTSGVVLSTARDAVDRDYRVIVLADGCADPAEDLHRALIDTVLPVYARITTVAGLDGIWQ